VGLALLLTPRMSDVIVGRARHGLEVTYRTVWRGRDCAAYSDGLTLVVTRSTTLSAAEAAAVEDRRLAGQSEMSRVSEL